LENDEDFRDAIVSFRIAYAQNEGGLGSHFVGVGV